MYCDSGLVNSQAAGRREVSFSIGQMPGGAIPESNSRSGLHDVGVRKHSTRPPAGPHTPQTHARSKCGDRQESSGYKQKQKQSLDVSLTLRTDSLWSPHRPVLSQEQDKSPFHHYTSSHQDSKGPQRRCPCRHYPLLKNCSPLLDGNHKIELDPLSTRRRGKHVTNQSYFFRKDWTASEESKNNSP